jgi:hypothetical protein
MRALGNLSDAQLQSIVSYANTLASAGTGSSGSGEHAGGDDGRHVRKAVVSYPRSVRFGMQAAGMTSASRSVALFNRGATAATLNTPSVTGDFAVGKTTCTTSLEPGARCTVDLTFTPTTLGKRVGTLTLGTTQVALSGAGTSASTPMLTPSVDQVIFPTGSLPGSAQTFTLTNSGPGELALGRLSLDGPHGADFSVVQTTCGATLAPGASCTITVSFTAMGKGLRSADLVVDSNAAGAPVAVPLAAQPTAEEIGAAAPATDTATAASPSTGGGGAPGLWTGVTSLAALLLARRRRP